MPGVEKYTIPASPQTAPRRNDVSPQRTVAPLPDRLRKGHCGYALNPACNYSDFGDDFRHARLLEDSAGAFLIKAQEPRAQLQRIPGGACTVDGPCSARNTMPLSGRRVDGYGHVTCIRYTVADQRRQFRLLVRVIFQHA